MAGNEYEDLDQQFEDIQAVLGKEMGKVTKIQLVSLKNPAPYRFQNEGQRNVQNIFKGNDRL